jgi:formylglycine-generating enzyme
MRPAAEQRAYLQLRLNEVFSLDERARSRLAAVLGAADWLSFGSPKASVASMTREECHVRREAAAQQQAKAPRTGDAECGAENMVLLYDPSRQSREQARVCIDQYEFPNIPCEYPVVWVRAAEAAELCGALGKRLCWAHEWEGACAGALLETSDEYPFSALPKVYEQPSQRRERRLQLEYLHNQGRQVRWAYGAEKAHERCATSGKKSPSCETVDFGTCGSNDFPAGAFPECVSPFGVYDQHGNVAEHMSLPLYPSDLEAGSSHGWTEMKGSWFIFAKEEAHPDDCRWRAKNWHTTSVDDPNSHRNYHLGFRCCRDVPPPQ